MSARTVEAAVVVTQSRVPVGRPRGRDGFARLALLLVVLAACDTPSLFHPPASDGTAIVVAFSRVGVAAITANRVPDAVRVRITSGPQTLHDSVVAFPGGSSEVRLRIGLEIPGDTAFVDVLVELLEGARVVGRAGRSTTLRRGEVTTVELLADDPSDNIALSDRHACYIDATGTTYCWGRNDNGQLGIGTTTGASRPVRVAGGPTFVAIDAGIAHTCALTGAGEAWCWGSNTGGQLGDGTTNQSTTPIAVTGNLRFRQIGTGTNYTCGLTIDSEAFCWGTTTFGVLGPGVTASLIPIPVAGNLHFDDLQVGFFDVCGIAAGQALCWGREIINGGNVFVNTPTPVPGGLQFNSVSPGNRNRCGVTIAGDAYCWSGDISNFGHLGNGSQTPSNGPVAVVGGHKFRVTSAARSNALFFFGNVCGLALDDRAWCWGLNGEGQLGTVSGTGTCSQPHVTNGLAYPCSTVPVEVSGNLRFDAISVGSQSACGLSDTGVYCWGSGVSGMLGQGDLEHRPFPARIADPIDPPVATGLVILTSPIVPAGDSILAIGYLFDQHGLAVPNPGIQWVSSDTTVVRVDPPPSPAFNEIGRRVLLRALSVGNAILTATSGPFTANAPILSTGPTSTASVQIGSITSGGVPVNLTNVQGDFDVTVVVDPGLEEITKLSVVMAYASQTVTPTELQVVVPPGSGLAVLQLTVRHSTLPKGFASLSVVATVSKPAAATRSSNGVGMIIN